MYNGYTFDHRKEPTYAQATDQLNKVCLELGFEKYVDWVKSNLAPHPYCYTNREVINICDRELAQHECHCNGMTTCEVCQSKAIAANDETEIPY